VTDPESGEVICSNCGMVVSDKIQDINRPERRAFLSSEEMNKVRTGAPISLARHDMGLSTIIGRTDKDAGGQRIDISTRSTMDRLRTWDFRIQNYTSTDRNLKQAFDQLDILKDKLGLSDSMVEKTAYIYRKAQERGFSRGRSIAAVLDAAIYIACREIGISRKLKEIATISNIKYKFLAKTYRNLVFELDLKIPVVDLMKCIVKVANKTNLSEKTKRKAMSIMNDITTKNEIFSAGKDPMGLAATILYLSCLETGEKITQGNIANAGGINGLTLRNRLKDLRINQLQ
jgi:transcription initiation factor TFIIB